MKVLFRGTRVSLKRGCCSAPHAPTVNTVGWKVYTMDQVGFRVCTGGLEQQQAKTDEPSFGLSGRGTRGFFSGNKSEVLFRCCSCRIPYPVESCVVTSVLNCKPCTGPGNAKYRETYYLNPVHAATKAPAKIPSSSEDFRSSVRGQG